MSGETFVDQLAAASAEAKQVLGDLRSEMRELRQLRKQLADEVAEARKVVAETVEEQLGDEVRRGLEKYAGTLQLAIEEGAERVNRQFEELYNTLMTGNRRGRAPDGFDLRNLGKQPKAGG